MDFTQGQTNAGASETMVADKPERAGDSASPTSSEDDDQEYTHGVKLAVVLTSLTLVYFLIMLDNTILATVSRPRDSTELMETATTTQILTMLHRPYHTL